MQRMARAQFGVVLAVIIAAGFWLNHAVPLGAGWLQGMKPWSEETTSKPKRAWDALLWDGVAQVYPWRVWMSRSLRSGYLPLWNPHQYCGYPMVGNGQSEVFYPPNWLLLILSPVTFLSVSLAFHAVAALLLTYLYCQCLKIGPWGSALAGLAFVMGGFFVTWAELAALVNTATWLPGCLLGIELLRLGRRSGLAVLAVCLGLTLLAGHMQIAAYVWIAAGVYVVIALGRGAADGGRLWLAAWIGLAFAGGLLLGCAQLLPTVELAINSSRGTAVPSAAGWAFWQMRAIQPVELATFVYPFALGNPARGTYPGLSFSEHCGYVGVVTLLLAAVALALRRDRLAWGFAVVAGTVLWITVGGPLGKLLYFHVPVFSRMGSFTRMLAIYTFLVSVLGGMGLDAVVRRALRPAVARTVAIVALLAVAAELVWFASVFVPRAQAAEVYPPAEAIGKLQSLAAVDERILAITPKAAWRMDRLPRQAVLPPNSATVYGLNSIQGYDSLVPRNIVSFAARLEGGQPAPATNGNMMLLECTDAAALGEAAVRWVLTGEPLAGEKWRLRWHRGGLNLYENLAAKPLVWVDGGRAQVISRGPNSLVFNITDPGRGEGTISQTCYPGWRLWSSGRAGISPRRSDPFWKLVCPAAATVRMDFWPQSVVCGLFLTLVAASVVTALTIFLLLTRRCRCTEEPAVAS